MSSGLPPPLRHMPDDLPLRIGSYPIRRLIGTGSMGVVYLGHDPVIDRPVAIKTIQRQLLESVSHEHNAAARFRVEAQAAGRLSHRNIVSVYQFGEDVDCAYIVMEYVPGHSLGEYLRRGDRFSSADVLCLMGQLLDALHYAHERGVVHRDIKPANVLVGTDGRLRITDFGIARTESSQATRATGIIGSPGYIAPERYTGMPLDHRVDVFSAGVLLFQLLTGSMPYSGTDEAIMYQIVYGQHESPVKRTGDASLARYEPILDRALSKSPAQRYASALEFRNALAALAQGAVAECLPSERLLPFQPAPPAGPLAPMRTAGGSTAPAAPAAAAVPAAPAAAAAAAGASGTVASVPVPTGWDESQLASLERELTVHVGPVAKVLVRRAARGQTDLAVVRNLVAASIADFELRQRFLAAGPRTAPGTAPPRSTATGFVATRPATAYDGVQLKPQHLEKAGVVLARAIGPIAKVLVKQCAARSSTREDFVAQLLAQVTQGVDTQRLEAELWRALA